MPSRHAATPWASAPAGRIGSPRCSSDLPGGTSWVVDLADLDGIDAFAARVDDEMGGVDVLVNNAGIPKRRRTTTMSAADAEGVMAMNYFSPVRLTLALLPRMIERARGDIVNVSSMGVHLVAFGVGAYSASKAALELFTESLYVELPGTGVRAHLVVPGTTATEFSTPRDDNDPPLPPGPTAATAEEVAAAIVACVESDELRLVCDHEGRCDLGGEGGGPECVPRPDARGARASAQQLAEVDEQVQ